MSENTLKFNNARVNKKEFHISKQPIDLGLVTVNQIVVSGKFRHSDEDFKYFIGYQEGEIIKAVLNAFEKHLRGRKSPPAFLCFLCIFVLIIF